MTAPLTPPPPPHGQSPDSSHSSTPSEPPASAHQAGQAPPPEEDGPGMRTEVLRAVVTTVLLAVAGVLLGLLWLWLAPRVPLVGDKVDQSWVVYLQDSEGEQAIAVDGTFTLLALAFGAVSAVAVFLLTRRRAGIPQVVALALGGLLGSVIAWRLGVWLGPTSDVIAHAKAVGENVTFPAQLKLGARSALLAWPVAALVVHLGLTALFGPRDPDPDEAGPYEGHEEQPS